VKTETEHRLRSARLGNERSIWIRPPCDGSRCEDLVVFFDAELYRNKVGAAEIVEAFAAEPSTPPTLFVFVSSESIASRWIECPCHPPFVSFVEEELFPWLEKLHPDVATCRRRVAVGLSYTGLAASYIAMTAPGRFTKVVSQSGSYWWNDGWLIEALRRSPVPPTAEFRLEVGRRETQTHVQHKQDVLQVMSQIEGVRRFRDALIEKGHAPTYVEFDGAHECLAWGRALPAALRWALAPPSDAIDEETRI
jgi:enterochelin esterase family protein